MPAMAALRFSPAESDSGVLPPNLSAGSPARDRASSTRMRISDSASPCLAGPNATSANTVSSKNWDSGN